MSHMSRSTQSTTLRTLALASAFLGVGLAAPAAGHAQAVTQEWTLLNRTATPSIAKAEAAPTAPTDPGIPGRDEGARALLNRTATSSIAMAKSDAAHVVPTNPGISARDEGARALLGLTPTSEQHELERGAAAVASPTDPPVSGERVLLGR